MEIRPLAAKVTANGSGNKTTVGDAQTVYICATADVLITNNSTGFTFQMHENQAIVMQKEKAEVHMEKFTSRLVMLGGNAPKKVSMITSNEQNLPSDTEEKTEEKVYRTFEDEVPY